MKHEIDLKNFEVRTDLISEIVEINENKNGIETKVKNCDGIKVTKVKIDEEGSVLLNKKVGNYITIEFDDVTDSSNREHVKKVFEKYFIELLKKNNIKDSDSVLIIGLGNSKSTPDSLGPLVVDKILVTNYLYMLGELDNGYRPVSAIKPGVTGETGIETSLFIKNVVDTLKPNFVIVIDALASKSLERVNTTIQFSDTGISPGSGIGNKRKEISFETVNVPVISIGVPTVVDAVTVVSDTIEYMYKHYVFSKQFLKTNMSKLVETSQMNYLKHDIKINKADKEDLLGLVGKLEDNEIRKLIYEVLTPIGYNLMVTPKEVDFVLEKISDVIALSLNEILHKKKNL